MKKLMLFTLLVAWGFFSFAQGIYNNGAYIVSTSGSYWVVDNGSFTLTSENSSQLAQFDNLIITDDASLALTAATCLTVNGDIAVNSGGEFTLNAASGSAASLIAAGEASGTVTAQSYLAETGKWHVVAAPVSAQNIWDFATLAGNSIAENAGKRAVTEYVEGVNTWDTNYPTGNTEGSFTAGSGYSVLRSEAGVVAYTGTINTSDVSKTLTRNLYGWNALGNPYTSAINATETAHTTNNLITANTGNFDPSFAALYLWDAATNTYVTINNTGTGSLVQNYIQAGQGFFVRAKDNTGLTFSITEAMQTHQTSTPLKSGETAWPSIHLAVNSNEKHSSTLLAFNDQMTTGLDVTYDAGMFKSDKNFALYTRLVDDNGVDFAIQALPQDYDNLIIPLGIDVPAGTEITFAAETMNLPAYSAVWLEDRSAGTFTRLDEADANYITLISENTKGVGNFYLHTQYSVTSANELESANAYRVLVNRNEGYLRIVTNEAVPGQAKLYDVAGRLHGVIELQQGADNKMYINGKPGVYVIRIAGGEKAFREKVVWN